MNKGLKIILVVCGAVAISVLVSMNVSDKGLAKPSSVIAVPGADKWNRHIVDSAVAMLRSGNIVLRMGLGADSHLLAKLNRKDRSYSHCGIVMVENGYPFVYHSIGGEDNPDERLRRDSANFFFSPRHNTAIAIVHFDYDAAGITRLQSVVRQFYQARPRFDMKFDLRTDDKLYCTEFVYKAVNKAMNDTAYIGTTTALGHTFVGTDNIFVNPHAAFILQMKFK